LRLFAVLCWLSAASSALSGCMRTHVCSYICLHLHACTGPRSISAARTQSITFNSWTHIVCHRRPFV
jgi:hypothetical protein